MLVNNLLHLHLIKPLKPHNALSETIILPDLDERTLGGCLMLWTGEQQWH
jgi:hypothetical protein